MKIIQFRGDSPNFGDELNSWLWPRLLPGFFNEDTSDIFIGIGSTIGMNPGESDVLQAYNQATKVIFGAGFVPDYHQKPDVSGNDWRVYFVRGPRTARRLNLDPALAIVDSGVLVRTCVDTSRYAPSVVSFMPHWESMEKGNWTETCREAGINLIDPRLPVQSIFKQLLRSKMVICEAMHGAIISDALRIPWVPVVPLNVKHREKWYDWSESLGIKLRPEILRPSALGEISEANNQIAYISGMDDVAINAANLVAKSNLSHLLETTKRAMVGSSLLPSVKPLVKSWVNTKLTDLAADRLVRLAKLSGQLSADKEMERVTTRMLEKLDLFQHDFGYMPYRLVA